MGWWRTDDGDALGDEPADIAAEELEQLNETLDRRLRVGELIGALDLVLEAKANDLLAAGADAPSRPLAAEIDTDGECTVIAGAHPVDDGIRNRIDTMCEHISAAYDQAFDRRPSLRELLASIQFVPGHGAETYLDLPEASRIRRIAFA